MDCTLNGREEALMAWHFGAAREDEADRLEAHLATCSRCLAAAFALKRDVERGAAARVRPSAVTRARTLRAADAWMAAQRMALASPRRMVWALVAAACVVAMLWRGLSPGDTAPRAGGRAAPGAGAMTPAAMRSGEAPAPLRSLEDGVDSGRADPAPLTVL